MGEHAASFDDIEPLQDVRRATSTTVSEQVAVITLMVILFCGHSQVVEILYTHNESEA